MVFGENKRSIKPGGRRLFKQDLLQEWVHLNEKKHWCVTWKLAQAPNRTHTDLFPGIFPCFLMLVAVCKANRLWFVYLAVCGVQSKQMVQNIHQKPLFWCWVPTLLRSTGFHQCIDSPRTDSSCSKEACKSWLSWDKSVWNDLETKVRSEIDWNKPKPKSSELLHPFLYQMSFLGSLNFWLS